MLTCLDVNSMSETDSYVEVSNIYPSTGETVTLIYSTYLPADSNLKEQTRFEFSGGLELVESSYETSEFDSDTKLVKLILSVRSFKPGRIIIPQQRIIYMNIDNNKENEVLFTEKYLNVNSLVSKETTDILDIKSPWSIQDAKGSSYLYLLVIFILIFFLTVILIRKKRVKKIEIKPLPAWEKAFSELEEIRKLPLNTDDEVKDFYLKLSDVFREYIENRYGITALEKTTYEFIAFMRTQENIFTEEQKILIKAFLDRCDLIKFARQKADNDEPVADIKLVKQFVENSKPKNDEEQGTLE